MTTKAIAAPLPEDPHPIRYARRLTRPRSSHPKVVSTASAWTSVTHGADFYAQ
jgi:hypothetical protein